MFSAAIPRLRCNVIVLQPHCQLRLALGVFIGFTEFTGDELL